MAVLAEVALQDALDHRRAGLAAEGAAVDEAGEGNRGVVGVGVADHPGVVGGFIRGAAGFSAPLAGAGLGRDLDPGVGALEHQQRGGGMRVVRGHQLHAAAHLLEVVLADVQVAHHRLPGGLDEKGANDVAAIGDRGGEAHHLDRRCGGELPDAHAPVVVGEQPVRLLRIAGQPDGLRLGQHAPGQARVLAFDVDREFLRVPSPKSSAKAESFSPPRRWAMVAK